MIWFYKGSIVLSILILTYFLIGSIFALILRLKNPLKNLQKNSNNIYLTFDDGIDSKYTEILLDLLKQYQIKASFFIMGKTIFTQKDILKRMKEEGHLIGLHSYKHKNQILQFPISLYKDYKKSIQAFKKLDIDIQYCRPPWGHLSFCGFYLNKHFNLKNIFWNVIVQDWEDNTSNKIIEEKLLRLVSGNSVICLHDGRGKNDAPAKTIIALEKCIPVWLERGYQFEKVDRLF